MGQGLGFNPSEVENVLRVFNSEYNKVWKALGADMKTYVVDKLAEVWYSEDAQDYWDFEVARWNRMFKHVNSLASELYGFINSCAYNYAIANGSSWQKWPWGFTGLPTLVHNFQKISTEGDVGVLDEDEYGTILTTNFDKYVIDPTFASMDKIKIACLFAKSFLNQSDIQKVEELVSEVVSMVGQTVEAARADISYETGISLTKLHSARDANAAGTTITG